MSSRFVHVSQTAMNIVRGSTAALLLLGCGGELRENLVDGDDGSDGLSEEVLESAVTDSSSSYLDNESPDTCAARVPEVHRPSSTSCPATRGAGDPIDATACPNVSSLQCLSDADCTEGINGRCFLNANSSCVSDCSYDGCLSDSDCSGQGACICRSSGSDSTANICLAGSCRTDTDCGPCGYCSPSLIDAGCFCPSSLLCTNDLGGACGDVCGHAYFCHTVTDTCVDAIDCSVGACGYNILAKSWSCESCNAAPP
jgi:hypothetical protein